MAGQLAIIIYAWSLAATFGSFVIWRVWLLFNDEARRFVASNLRKWIVYGLVTRRPKGSSNLSYLHLAFLLLYGTANVVILRNGLTSAKQLSQRAASLYIINSIPLYLGGRTSIFVDKVLKVPLNTYNLAHRWLGRVCVLLAMLHTGICVSQVGRDLKPTHTAMISVLGFLALFSLLPVRRRAYELFLATHRSLAVALNILLWFHVGARQRMLAMCLGLASGLWILQQLLRISYIFMRNGGLHASNSASVQYCPQLNGPDHVMRLDITLRRPWKFRPGQYVYLSMPAIGRYGTQRWQAHPYFIAATDDSKKVITLLIESRRGFSRDLLSHRHTNVNGMIEGPYGSEPNLDTFDKVLLMANGIGIAALLLVAKALVDSHTSKTARVRRLTLVWLLDSKDQEAWAKEFLEKLLQQDAKRRILAVHLYVDIPGNEGKVLEGPRGWFMVNGKLDISWLINREWDAEAGNMAIAACGPPDFEYAIRQALKRNKRDIRLLNMGFEPDGSRMSAKRPERFYVTDTNPDGKNKGSRDAILPTSNS